MSVCSSVLAWLDGILCLFVFFPLAILHWRGTWGLQDVYFYPQDEAISGWISLAGGTVGCILLPFLHPFLFTERVVAWKKTYFFLKRLYMYICGWFVMMYWRGVWNLTDYYLTEAWLNSVIIYVICHLFTILTRTSRNNVGLPFCIALDCDRNILKPDVFFNTTVNNKCRYLLDIMYCQLLVVTAGILVWRGIWNVYDTFLFPHDHDFSDVVSLGLGYLLCIQLFLLQWPAGITSGRLDEYSPIWKIVFEDLIMFVACWGNLLVWRGAWDLCVKYFIPDPLVGGWISHWIGTIGLVSLQAFNSVTLNGLEKDGQWMNGEGIFNTCYLRVLLKDRCLQQKKTDVEYSYLIRNAADCDDCVDDVMNSNVNDVDTSSDDDINTQTYMASRSSTNGLLSGSHKSGSNGWLLRSNGPRSSHSNGHVAHNSSASNTVEYTALAQDIANGVKTNTVI